MALCIGLMSGTSADGMDACLVDISNDSIKLVDAICLNYPHDVTRRLRDIALSEHLLINDIATLDQQLASYAVSAVQALLKKANIKAEDVMVIGSHGHTLRHQAQPNGFSWQLGNPSYIAEHCRIDCVADFRRRDIAAGGQGAPLVPAFHQFALKQLAPCAVVNIGGIANITVVDDVLIGFDTGPGNALMDEWCLQNWNTVCDQGGNKAASGQVIEDLLDRWLAHPYFSAPAPKSTGRELFNLTSLGELNHYCAEDIAATLTEFTARSIALAVTHFAQNCRHVMICGGGVHNANLMHRLSLALPTHKIESTSEVGIDPDWMEAMAFAWLGWRTINGLPGNIPSVTGAAGERILGGIYKA
ncbi:anhydro-N-acetylmuramic acid kinase [Thalassolituus sp.]|jgi:anhydro-N-acetylmuramic acid kinase|uniref:anhydro-N-acetylmuramic acid kinase n=1 Tax=Thalassolituus sp. TaxID=2030822 RepID=UPI0032D957F8